MKPENKQLVDDAMEAHNTLSILANRLAEITAPGHRIAFQLIGSEGGAFHNPSRLRAIIEQAVGHEEAYQSAKQKLTPEEQAALGIK